MGYNCPSGIRQCSMVRLLQYVNEGNMEVWLKVGSPVAFVEAGGEVYKD